MKKLQKKESTDRKCSSSKEGGAVSGSIPPKNKTWQWKIHHLNMYFLLNMGIFQPVMLVFRGGGVHFCHWIFSVGLPGLRGTFFGALRSHQKEKMPRKITQPQCATRWFFGGFFFLGVRRSLGEIGFFFVFFTVSYHRIHHQQGPPFWENIFGSLFPSIEELQIHNWAFFLRPPGKGTGIPPKWHQFRFRIGTFAQI